MQLHNFIVSATKMKWQDECVHQHLRCQSNPVQQHHEVSIRSSPELMGFWAFSSHHPPLIRPWSNLGQRKFRLEDIWTTLWCLNLIKIFHQLSLLQLVQRRVLRVYRNERIPGKMWLIKAVVSENVTSGWKSSRPHRKHNHVFVPAAERSLTFLWGEIDKW